MPSTLSETPSGWKMHAILYSGLAGAGVCLSCIGVLWAASQMVVTAGWLVAGCAGAVALTGWLVLYVTWGLMHPRAACRAKWPAIVTTVIVAVAAATLWRVPRSARVGLSLTPLRERCREAVAVGTPFRVDGTVGALQVEWIRVENPGYSVLMRETHWNGGEVTLHIDRGARPNQRAQRLPLLADAWLEIRPW